MITFEAPGAREDPRASQNPRVAYADGDPSAVVTAEYLRSHAVDVHVVTHPDSAVVEILRTRPDVVLCERTLKVASGREVWRVVREHLDVPTIVLSATADEADQVISLETGADDYIVKPFSQRQFLARIRAQARRARGNVGPAKTQITVGELSVDCATMTVALRGQQVPVTTYEFALTRVLAERAGRVLTREQLLELVQGSTEEAFDRSVDVHISRLRHKFGDDPRSPRLVKTVRGVGYMLMPRCA